MAEFWPLFNNSAQLRLRVIQDTRTVTGGRYCWHQFNFLTAGNLTSGTTGSLWTTATYLHVVAMMQNTIQAEGYMGSYEAYWVVNNGGVNRFANYGGDIGVTQNYPVNVIGANLRLVTSIGERWGRGNFHYPYVFPTEWVNGRTSPALTTRLTPLLNFLTSSWVACGITLYPSVWSRTRGLMVPIQKVIITTLPAICQKRKQTGRKECLPIAPPFSWPIVP